MNHKSKTSYADASFVSVNYVLWIKLMIMIKLVLRCHILVQELEFGYRLQSLSCPKI